MYEKWQQSHFEEPESIVITSRGERIPVGHLAGFNV